MDRTRVQSAAALVWAALLSWFSYGRGGTVPVLVQVDVALHHLGRDFGKFMPVNMSGFLGAVLQLGVPLGLALFFFSHAHGPHSAQRVEGLIASAFAAWAGTGMRSVSVNMVGVGQPVPDLVWIAGLVLLAAALALACRPLLKPVHHAGVHAPVHFLD